MNKDSIVIPAAEIPSYRTMVALRDGTADNLLFTTWGGIGDQICAEPTLRFALDSFKNCKVSLATPFPEFFSHLKFHKVYNTNHEKPDLSKYLVFQTINNPESLTWEFVSHCVTHCVDFPSICAIRCTVPISYKAIQMPVDVCPTMQSYLTPFLSRKHVAIHAGKHWESKTFPKWWWDKVISLLKQSKFVPVIIGKELEEHQGTVDVDVDGCVDLRNKLSLTESIWLLQRMRYLVCNDSSPMHMAATGNAHIAFVATAKHQDYLYHWRNRGLWSDGSPIKTEWAWRMQHFNKGGMWDVIDYSPNKKETVLVDKCSQEDLLSWLPEPEEIVEWIATRD